MCTVHTFCIFIVILPLRLFIRHIVSHNSNWVACSILLYYALLGGNVVQCET